MLTVVITETMHGVIDENKMKAYVGWGRILWSYLGILKWAKLIIAASLRGGVIPRESTRWAVVTRLPHNTRPRLVDPLLPYLLTNTYTHYIISKRDVKYYWAQTLTVNSTYIGARGSKIIKSCSIQIIYILYSLFLPVGFLFTVFSVVNNTRYIALKL